MRVIFIEIDSQVFIFYTFCVHINMYTFILLFFCSYTIIAMSKIYPSGQFVHVVHCGLCDTDENVNWFCKTCVKYLCDHCKKMHSKIPSCENHEIGTVGEGRKATKDKTNSLCKDHGEPILYLCKTCDSTELCLKCAGGRHHKHDLESIEDMLEKMRKDFKEDIRSLLASQSELSKAKKALHTHVQKINSDIETSINEIKERHEEITKLKAEFVQSLEAERERSKRQIEESNTTLLKSIADLDAVVQAAETEAAQRSGLALVKFFQEFK